MSNINCPVCGNRGSLLSPDYGRGAEFICYRCHVYGHRFAASGGDAEIVSNASRAVSMANAERYRDEKP